MDKNIDFQNTHPPVFMNQIAAQICRMWRDKFWRDKFLHPKIGGNDIVTNRANMTVLIKRRGTHSADPVDSSLIRLHFYDPEVCFGWSVRFKYHEAVNTPADLSFTHLELEIGMNRSRFSWSQTEYDAVNESMHRLLPEKTDEQMSPVELEHKYVNLNGGYHQVHRVEHWQGAVLENFTRSGYWEWVHEQLQQFDPSV